MELKVVMVAVDGGPSAGKSTGMARMAQALESAGIIPLVVPEAATLLIKGGITPWDLGPEEFQRRVARMQIDNEELWLAAARLLSRKHGRRVVVLCDRGLVGAAAYLPGENRLEQLDAILKGLGTGVEEARSRYAGVIHLVTAANGAEEFYTLANNSARTESPEEARAVDSRTIDAWLGHSHLAVVRNVDRGGRKVSFDEKMRRAVAEMFRILGYPEPLEIEDKYLLQSFDPTILPANCETVSILQTYLLPEEKGSEERVRMRQWLGNSSFYHTVKRPAPGGGRIEIERKVSSDEYIGLLARMDPDKIPIKKVRHSFVWEGQYFEVDVFAGRHEGLIILERERTDVNDDTVLPPFIRAERDVTDDPQFKNSALAARV